MPRPLSECSACRRDIRAARPHLNSNGTDYLEQLDPVTLCCLHIDSSSAQATHMENIARDIAALTARISPSHCSTWFTLASVTDGVCRPEIIRARVREKRARRTENGLSILSHTSSRCLAQNGTSTTNPIRVLKSAEDPVHHRSSRAFRT